MKLTNRQIDHMFQRITAAVEARTAAEIKKLGEQPKCKDISFAEKMRQISDGTAKLKSNVHDHSYLTSAFVFENDEKAMAAYKAWETKANTIRRKLNKEKQDLEDKIVMSGNGDEALALLASYEAGKI